MNDLAAQALRKAVDCDTRAEELMAQRALISWWKRAERYSLKLEADGLRRKSESYRFIGGLFLRQP